MQGSEFLPALKINMTVHDAYNLINELPKFTTKHTFEEGRTFLDRLGSPDEGLKVIHVAGTNGKGSVCAYMESILMHAGYTVGCFISPHLNDMRERIRINGQMCGEDDFREAVSEVKALAEDFYWPTYFEYLFFVSMLVFKKHRPDIVILETGLGGRLDATNLVRDKLMSVITSIGLDHCEYLGNTCDHIASEKAGIIMYGRPVIYWDDTPGADIIDSVCTARHSVKIALSKTQIIDIHRSNRGIDFCFRYKYDKFICLNLGTCALYQVENACLAVAALARIPDICDRISSRAMIDGVSSMVWPGRMEEIRKHIFLDGAHNEPAVEALLQTVREDGAASRLLIFGCMADKAYVREIGLIADSGLFEKCITVAIGSARALDAGKLAESFRAAGVDAESVDSVSEAWKMACAYTGSDESSEDGSGEPETDSEASGAGYVYIAGSLYLIGEMRGLIDDKF